MKVWFNAKVMWDWSTNMTDKNCLAVDGPAQDKVYAERAGLPSAASGSTTASTTPRTASTTPSRPSSPSRPRAMPPRSTTLGAKLARLLQAPVSQTSTPGKPDTVWTVADTNNETAY